VGAIRRKEKNHGIEESDQEAEEGQESTTDEDPRKVLAERFFIHVLVTAHGAIRRKEKEQGIEETNHYPG
jgi:hypothetical protein